MSGNQKGFGFGEETNASDFIRMQPMSATAPEVVDAGKKAGFEFSTSLVYAVRGRMKKATPGPSPGKREAVPPKRGLPPTSGRLEAQMQELVDSFVRDMSALVRRAALDSVRQALGDLTR